EGPLNGMETRLQGPSPALRGLASVSLGSRRVSSDRLLGDERPTRGERPLDAPLPRGGSEVAGRLERFGEELVPAGIARAREDVAPQGHEGLRGPSAAQQRDAAVANGAVLGREHALGGATGVGGASPVLPFEVPAREEGQG